MLDGLLMAHAAGFLRDAQIAGIHEANELRRFVIQQDIGIGGISGRRPELRMQRLNMRFELSEAGCGIAAVTIRAAEHDISTDVHGRIFETFMALDATLAFVRRFIECLIDPISRGQHVRNRFRQIARNRNGRAEADVVGESE
jgi:hypothetical protein